MPKINEVIRKYKTEFKKIPKSFSEEQLDRITDYMLEKTKQHTYVLSGELRRANHKRRVNKKTTEVYNDADYANAIEFGRKSSKGGRTKTHPFMRPASKDTQKYIRREFKNMLLDALKEAQNG